MTHTSQSGFGMIAVIGIIGVLAAAYFVKDEHGVSYLEDGYNAARYYTVDRNVEALKSAKEVQVTAQLQQNKLQAELDK